jgi:tetratricopeptide (TPR) repeat protein
MEVMSDNDIRRMIEEATKESLRQSFTEAGRKFLEAAEISEQKGDFPGAEKLYAKAAETYLKAAETYRASKSFKNAALNMCAAGDVYSDMADAQKAVVAYEGGAQDLISAAREHLMWGESAEILKATALAMTACMIYIMIGKEADAFQKARMYSAENASKISLPVAIRLSQIPQMLESAIRNEDISVFSSAETVVVSELKSSLVNSGAQDFVKYVDKGLDMVREILRGKLKVPKVVTHLEIPVDMTFTDNVQIKALVNNVGDGDALRPAIEWLIDDGLTLVSGEAKKSISVLPAGESVEFGITLRSSEELMGVKEYSLMMRGSYSDKLHTEYSFQAGPGTLVLKDYKETEKLLHDLDVTDGRVGLLGASIDESQFERAPLKKILKGLDLSLKSARTDIQEHKLDVAGTRILMVNEIVDTLDDLLGDEALLQSIVTARTNEKKAFAKSVLTPMRQALQTILTGQEKKIKGDEAIAASQWEKESKSKRELGLAISTTRDYLSDLARDIDAVYTQMPSAAATDSPTEAANRTKLRTAVDTAKAKTLKARAQLESLLTHEALKIGDKRAAQARVELAQVVARSIINDLAALLDSKLTELK